MNNDETTLIGIGSVNLEKIFPIGSVYINIGTSDPSVLFGGHWSKIGEGRTLIQASTSYPLQSMGGGELVSLEVENLPAHNHSASSDSQGNHNHNRGNMNITGEVSPVESSRENQTADDKGLEYSGALKYSFYDNFGGYVPLDGTAIKSYTKRGIVRLDASKNWTGTTNTTGAHSHNISVANTGSNVPINVMQPFLAVNIWYRVA